MQTIERYGVIVLVLCAVSIGAVWMWEREGEPTPNSIGSDSEQVARTNPKASPPAARVIERGKRDHDSVMGDTLSGNVRSALSLENLNTLREVGSDIVSDASERLRQLGGTQQAPPVAPAVVPAIVPQQPAATDSKPKATPVVATGGSGIYVVKTGDTLSEISLRELGTSKRYREILKLNPGLDETRVLPGTRLKLPAPGTNATPSSPKSAVAKQPAPGANQVRVQAGDTLMKISSRVLGDGTRYLEFAAVNPGLDVDNIIEGQLLNVPTGAKPKVTSRPPTTVAKNTRRTGKVL